MFRFTIRDVLWLMVVAALCVSWWLNNRDHVAQAVEAKARFNALDAKRQQTELNLFALKSAAKSVGIDAVEKPEGHLMITKTDPPIIVPPKPATLNRP